MRTRGLLAVIAATLLLAVGCDQTVDGRGKAAAQSTTDGSATPGTGHGGGLGTDAEGTLTTKKFDKRDHAEGKITYADSPPFGGTHNPVWIDCTGKAYTSPVRTESAVHSLEHGAVWITYQPDLDPADVATLQALVDGKNYSFLSPYPGLDHAVSLQTWGFQYKTDDVDDPGIGQFITERRQNPDTTPEYGATCATPSNMQAGDTASSTPTRRP